MATRLTKKQRAVYNFLKEKIKSYGYPPSIEEICEKTNITSTNEVKEIFDILKNAGYIEINYTNREYIKILEDNFYSLNINTTTIKDKEGNIYKNIPVFTLKNLQEIVPASINFLKKNKYFLLKSLDNSMANVNIFSNSKILIDPNYIPKNYGDILLVLVNNKILLRFVFVDKDNFILKCPDNSVEDIIVKELFYLGKLVYVFNKKYKPKNIKRDDN